MPCATWQWQRPNKFLASRRILLAHRLIQSGKSRMKGLGVPLDRRLRRPSSPPEPCCGAGFFP